jgi:hypothetical protein
MITIFHFLKITQKSRRESTAKAVGERLPQSIRPTNALFSFPFDCNEENSIEKRWQRFLPFSLLRVSLLSEIGIGAHERILKSGRSPKTRNG